MTNYEVCSAIIGIGVPAMILIMVITSIKAMIDSIKRDADFNPDYWFNRVKRTLGFKYLSERKIMDDVDEAMTYAENCPYMDDYEIENWMLTRNYVVAKIIVRLTNNGYRPERWLNSCLLSFIFCIIILRWRFIVCMRFSSMGDFMGLSRQNVEFVVAYLRMKGLLIYISFVLG